MRGGGIRSPQDGFRSPSNQFSQHTGSGQDTFRLSLQALWPASRLAFWIAAGLVSRGPDQAQPP